MFNLCSSLQLLNLKNFNATKISDETDMLNGVDNNLIYCANETKILNIKSLFTNYKNNCTNLCFLNPQSKYILEKMNV